MRFLTVSLHNLDPEPPEHDDARHFDLKTKINERPPQSNPGTRTRDDAHLDWGAAKKHENHTWAIAPGYVLRLSLPNSAVSRRSERPLALFRYTRSPRLLTPLMPLKSLNLFHHDTQDTTHAQGARLAKLDALSIPVKPFLCLGQLFADIASKKSRTFSTSSILASESKARSPSHTSLDSGSSSSRLSAHTCVC